MSYIYSIYITLNWGIATASMYAKEFKTSQGGCM